MDVIFDSNEFCMQCLLILGALQWYRESGSCLENCYRHNLARPEGGLRARWAQRIIIVGLRIGPCASVSRPGLAMYLDRYVRLN
jgi:hypothetical protein